MGEWRPKRTHAHPSLAAFRGQGKVMPRRTIYFAKRSRGLPSYGWHAKATVAAVLERAEKRRAQGELDAALRDCDRILASIANVTGSPEVDAGRVRTLYLPARVLAAMGSSSEALDQLRVAVLADPALIALARREPDFAALATSTVGDAYRKLVGQSLVARLFGSSR
jgi:hypothetical protein